MRRQLGIGFVGVALLATAFAAGRLSVAPDTLADDLRMPVDVLFTDDRIVGDRGMQTYANYRAALAEGRISTAWTDGSQLFSEAERVPAHDAIPWIGQYPAPANALYAFYRALEMGSRGDLTTVEGRRRLVFAVPLAEGAKYMALTEGDSSAFEAASRAEDCLLGAFAEEALDVVAQTCVPDLAGDLEPILGFRPVTGARQRGAWSPPGTPGN